MRDKILVAILQLICGARKFTNLYTAINVDMIRIIEGHSSLAKVRRTNWLEHKTPNLGVGGSSPPARAIFILMSPIKGAFFYYNIAVFNFGRYHN